MKPQTDWNEYYDRPYRTAGYSRRITLRLLVDLLKKYAPADRGALTIMELGGANSCFYEQIARALQPARYIAVDNNALGLTKMKERCGGDPRLIFRQQDILQLQPEPCADVVFSVGLIEHFSPVDTARAVAGHFALVKPGGIVLLSFPTPTWLYRASRFVSEKLDMWIFHDERPLGREEVVAEVQKHGRILFEKINWPIFFTQLIVVARKL